MTTAPLDKGAALQKLPRDKTRVSHTMGLDWVLKAFIVVVVGGMGNFVGSIAAAIFISLIEAYTTIWLDPSRAVIVSFVILILTLLFRPTGLFAATPR